MADEIDWDALDFAPSCSTRGHGDLSGPFAAMHDDGPAVFALVSTCPNCRLVTEQLVCRLVGTLMMIDIGMNGDSVFICNECQFGCELQDRQFQFIDLD